MISTSGENVTNFICEFGSAVSFDHQETKKNMMEDFYNSNLIKDESNLSYKKINFFENLKKSSNIINTDKENIIYGCKELHDEKKPYNHEVITYCSTSPALTEGSSECSQVRYKQDVDCLNLEENISFGLCEETPSLQEMLETTNKCTKKQFVIEIPTFEAEMKQGSDLEQNEMELQNIHGQRLIYECDPRYIPSPLNLEENHEFQHDLEGQTIKEMLETSFHSASHEFVFAEGQSKGSLGYGNEGLIPKILQQDLQQVIIQQLNLEQSHLLAESIEDHESNEMQDSPIGSEGQDFLDEIMTCEVESNEEIGTTKEKLNVYDASLEEFKIHEKKKNSNIESNLEHTIERDNYEVCPTLNKHVNGYAEGKRYLILLAIILNLCSKLIIQIW